HCILASYVIVFDCSKNDRSDFYRVPLPAGFYTLSL
ncbi:MAG: hypothetical protein ACI87Q_001777, partial [Pseudohongiellaceae bacterium]